MKIIYFVLITAFQGTLAQAGTVVGYVDTYDAETRVLQGWTCENGRPGSIDIAMVVPNGSPSGWEMRDHTNIPHEQAVTAACGGDASPHRFHTQVPAGALGKLRGRTLTVFGINSSGAFVRLGGSNGIVIPENSNTSAALNAPGALLDVIGDPNSGRTEFSSGGEMSRNGQFVRNPTSYPTLNLPAPAAPIPAQTPPDENEYDIYTKSKMMGQ